MDKINYMELLNRAMQHLIANALGHVAERGLPGESYFVINFATAHPDVELAEHLRQQHPDDMTIILQYWFKDLEVGDDGFRVTLNFQDVPHSLYVPYQSIISFVDPGAKFGLQCQVAAEETESDERPADESESTPRPDEGGTQSDAGSSAKIVSLDNFRKS
ncbi:MAG: ClpXP protease specificity-enhancing factor SspB [Albidovulum sp.]|nr:ClpXP protease specificity-enhancing factor SspB [Albidovulum sp.]MDE0531254.1 ClpXP protease specificity-enhancing factor SspB [Albidovulum sp.]